MRGFTAREVLEADEFESVRSLWSEGAALVDQIDYQLGFRSRFDHLAIDVNGLAELLQARPRNGAIDELGLYMWDREYEELQRRIRLGDRMDAVVEAITGVPPIDPAREGEEPRFGPLFAGIWQDQNDGGRIVVAVTDLGQVDLGAVAGIVGGSELVRVVEQRYSYDETNRIRDRIVAAMQEGGIEASVVVTTSGEGRRIEIWTPEVSAATAAARRVASADAFRVVDKGSFKPIGYPQQTHTWGDLQPGLAIAVGSGSGSAGEKCTWGFNGHTSAYNYVVTAGHCAPTAYENYTGWVSGSNKFEISQTFSTANPWPRIVTVGDTFLKSVYSTTYDMLRAESPYADDNCYHGSGGSSAAHCQWPMANRALHNSWEVNSDVTCASLGSSNTYRCGLILEENFEGRRKVRAAISAVGGDSGAGAKYSYTIDGIIVEAAPSGEVLFGTAYDVKAQLGFDFNCASGARYLPANQWGACPAVNR